MDKKLMQDLIARYNQQLATADDLKQIEILLERGDVDLSDLHDAARLDDRLSRMEMPEPSANLDVQFYQMLAQERKTKSRFSWKQFFSWPELMPRLALASVMLVIGVAIGYVIKSPETNPSEDMASVKTELTQLKEMMMLSLLEKESPTERLKAVSLTSEMSEASSKVTAALIATLNEDENVNVRLAALEALKPYAREGSVRKELIRSIAKQDSPLVQIALADLMAQLQAKSSVTELEKILRSDRTPQDVKNRIKQSIDILI